MRDYILISAAFGAEIFEEVRLAGGILPSAMQNMYGFVPSKYKRRSYLTKVSEMLSVGDIKREVDSKGRSYLVLSSSGKEKFRRKFRIFRDSHKWDGFFMIASFDIAEKKRKTRDFIRGKLIELGFGMLQESVWVSPYHFEEDLKELTETYRLEDEVLVLTAKSLFSDDITKQAEKIWRLGKINKGYKAVIKNVEKTKVSKNMQKYIDKAFEIYTETLSKDPLLPKKLLPKNWLREKALNALNNI